jgi:hypothetical protein
MLAPGIAGMSPQPVSRAGNMEIHLERKLININKSGTSALLCA